jgi:hypothetical protein
MIFKTKKFLEIKNVQNMNIFRIKKMWKKLNVKKVQNMEKVQNVKNVHFQKIVHILKKCSDYKNVQFF